MTQTHANIDAAEVARFEALAHRWWDKSGAMKALHDINPLRANYIDEFAQVAGKTLLDVGCGGGILSEAMAQRGAQVSAIDAGAEPINVAKLHLLESGLNIDYQQSTAEQFAQHHTEQFDVITCLEMLEHVPDPSSVVAACAELCKAGGDLFFSTINRNAKSWLMMVVGAEYVMNMVPKGTHQYEKFIRPSELSRALRQAGLKIESIIGMEYNPLSKNYFLSDNVDVNYIIHAKKLASWNTVALYCWI